MTNAELDQVSAGFSLNVFVPGGVVDTVAVDIVIVEGQNGNGFGGAANFVRAPRGMLGPASSSSRSRQRPHNVADLAFRSSLAGSPVREEASSSKFASLLIQSPDPSRSVRSPPSWDARWDGINVPPCGFAARGHSPRFVEACNIEEHRRICSPAP